MKSSFAGGVSPFGAYTGKRQRKKPVPSALILAFVVANPGCLCEHVKDKFGLTWDGAGKTLRILAQRGLVTRKPIHKNRAPGKYCYWDSKVEPGPMPMNCRDTILAWLANNPESTISQIRVGTGVANIHHKMYLMYQDGVVTRSGIPNFFKYSIIGDQDAR